MIDSHIEKISSELDLPDPRVRAVASLLESDCTVPFIARYRKEATGSLDEVIVTTIRDRLRQLAELDQRRLAILKSLEKNGRLNDELQEKIESARPISYRHIVPFMVSLNWSQVKFSV